MYYLIAFYSGQVEVEAKKKIFNFWIITTFNRKASQPSFTVYKRGTCWFYAIWLPRCKAL